MKTLAEVLAAIKTLSPEEKHEIKLYLRELAAKEAQKAAAENPRPKRQAPLGATSQNHFLNMPLLTELCHFCNLRLQRLRSDGASF
jgi:hypothetical protein